MFHFTSFLFNSTEKARKKIDPQGITGFRLFDYNEKKRMKLVAKCIRCCFYCDSSIHGSKLVAGKINLINLFRCLIGTGSFSDLKSSSFFFGIFVFHFVSNMERRLEFKYKKFKYHHDQATTVTIICCYILLQSFWRRIVSTLLLYCQSQTSGGLVPQHAWCILKDFSDLFQESNSFRIFR